MRQVAHYILDTKLSSNSVSDVVLKRSNETINGLKRYKLHFHKDTCFRSKLKTTNCIIQITNQINYLQRCRVRWQLAWDRCEFFAFATNGYFQVSCWTITRYWTRSRWSSGDKKRCKQQTTNQSHRTLLRDSSKSLHIESPRTTTQFQ